MRRPRFCVSTAICFQSIGAWRLLFSVDWRMALITLLPLPFFFLLYRKIMLPSQAKMADYGQELEKLNRSVVEFVQGIRW